METITIYVPYGIVFRNNRVVDALWLNPYLLNEGLRELDDLCQIEINVDTYRILQWITDYLSHVYDINND